MERQLSAVISGSFKYKPEIDITHETLTECNVVVLEPPKGWIVLPPLELIELSKREQIRPLPTEEALSTREIEDRFLRSMVKANFLYVMNVEGYIGNSTAFELGYALALQIPIYAYCKLDYETMEVEDLEMRSLFEHAITILPPEAAVEHYRQTFC